MSSQRSGSTGRSRSASKSESGHTVAKLVLTGMAVGAIVCLVLGIVEHGASAKSVFPGAMASVVGIAYVAIGVFEIEWLERLVGLHSWFSSFSDRLSESDLFGGRATSRIYLVLGPLLYGLGCVLNLRLIGF